MAVNALGFLDSICITVFMSLCDIVGISDRLADHDSLSTQRDFQGKGPFKCYVALFFWKLDPHPPPRNANNIEHYTFVTLFSRKSDTPPRFVAGNMDVNTPASKRSQLIGSSDCSKAPRNPQKVDLCVLASFMQLPRKRRDARFDLWPALHVGVGDERCTR